jgi:anti-anti-sigma factor
MPPMTSTSLDIQETRESPRSVRLALSGELDLASAPALEGRLAQLRGERQSVHLDLAKLEFIDSTGIRLLIDALNDARQDGWNLEIGPELSPPVSRVFELVWMDRVIRGELGPGR